jgi:hypothetical protein
LAATKGLFVTARFSAGSVETGNPWAEDPGCYLSDDEIGVVDMPQRAAVTPYRHRQEVSKAVLFEPEA